MVYNGHWKIMMAQLLSLIRNLFRPPFYSRKLEVWKQQLQDAKRQDFLEKFYESLDDSSDYYEEEESNPDGRQRQSDPYL